MKQTKVITIRNHLLIFLIKFLLLTTTPLFTQAQTISKLDGTKITTSEIDQIVTQLMDAAKVNGLSLAILNKNKPVYVKAYGYRYQAKNELLDTATVNYAASFSKSVFAVLVLQLKEQGIIDLDKPLYQYLKKPISAYEDFAELAKDERYKQITARMCLSHTTGLPNTRWINVRTGEMDTLVTSKFKCSNFWQL